MASITPEVRAAVVEAYERGEKIRQIEERFGIPRATLYWILEQANVQPSRVKAGHRMAGGDVQLRQLYELITAQDKRIQELEAELAKLRKKR